jgi:L-fuculose-phosphate aldolase
MNPARSHIADALCAAGLRLDALGLVPARDGNLSARIGERSVLVTGTGVRKRELTPAHLVEVDLDGRVLRGRGRPSTELGLHLACYRHRPDVKAVMHAHPPTAVGFACAGRGLTDCLMPEVAVHLGSVPLTPYATPGTPELEAAIAGVLHDHDAFLLANHGAVTMGSSVDEALDRMETLEHFARIALTAEILGGPTSLPAGAVAVLEVMRRKMGNPRPVTCTPASAPGPASAARSASGPSSLPPASQVGDPAQSALVDRVARAVLAVLRGGNPPGPVGKEPGGTVL